MARKISVFSLTMVLVLAMVTLASAAPNVTSNSQKGSLIVFPKVITASFTSVNTYFFIGNDAAVATWVKCFWMDENQTTWDFMFLLTPNQPVVFDALTGHNEFFDIPPFGDYRSGSLVCFAQSADDRTPQDFDHLYGTALLKWDQSASYWTYYDAFSFAARGSNYYSYLDATGAVTVDPAAAVSVRLNLTGDTGYDTCPAYLLGNFIPEFGALMGSGPKLDLTLWPCRQDLRQDRIPTCTKAKFDIWNENEVKFTGAYQCFKCFFEGFLTNIGYPNGKSGSGVNEQAYQKFLYNRGPGFGGDKFSIYVLKTEVARFRVQGIYSSVCVTQQNAQGTAVAKTKVISGTKCPNINVDGSKSTSFITAWGNTNTITPLLGMMLYGPFLDFTTLGGTYGVSPFAGYTLHGAGQATGDPNVPGSNVGWIKADIGGGVLEKAAK